MGMKFLWQISAVVGISGLLASCGKVDGALDSAVDQALSGGDSQKASEVVHKKSDVPKLITFAERQKERMTESGAQYAAQVFDQHAYGIHIVGDNIELKEQVLNEGPDSKGLRFVLRGSALEQGILGTPSKVEVTSFEQTANNKITGGSAPMDDSKGPLLSKQVANVALGASGTCVGQLPDLPYRKVVDLTISLPAQKVGAGDVYLDVYPIDAKGTSSAKFVEKVAVKDKSYYGGAPDAADSQAATE